MTEEVLAAVRGRAEALASGDPDRLGGWLHEGFVWTSHRGEVLDRDAYVTANTGPLRWLSQELVDPHVAVVGDTAVVVGTVRDVVERDGERMAFAMRITQTWVRVAGAGWRCLAGHAGPQVTGDQR
jgi:Domain of unknown function (DUF4440)